MRMTIAGAVALGLVLSGCQTVQHQTASGRPEITVARPAADVKSAWAGYLVNRGYTITKDTDLQVVGEIVPNNAMAHMFFGSRYDGVPKARLTATYLSIGGGTRMVVDPAIVTNPGSAFERVTPLNNHPDTAGIQQTMNDLKEALDRGRKPGDAVADAIAKSDVRRAASQPTQAAQAAGSSQQQAQ
ncbi:hypothetical protein [Microvirga subterranea]|nr:hypothetical protein [Microvirga subterranea]